MLISEEDQIARLREEFTASFSGVVGIELEVLTETDFLLDELSERLVGTILLQDVRYSLAGADVEKGQVLLNVSGRLQLDHAVEAVQAALRDPEDA